MNSPEPENRSENRRLVTCDYSVPLTVRLNIDTGEVDSVWLHLDCFQDCPKGRWEQGERTTYFRDVFFAEGFEDDLDGRELLDGEHPLADKAFELAQRVRLVKPEFEVAFEVDDA